MKLLALLKLLAHYLPARFFQLHNSNQNGKKAELSLPVYQIKLYVSKKTEVILQAGLSLLKLNNSSRIL